MRFPSVAKSQGGAEHPAALTPWALPPKERSPCGHLETGTCGQIQGVKLLMQGGAVKTADKRPWETHPSHLRSLY